MCLFQSGIVDYLKEKKIKISYGAHRKYGATVTGCGNPFMKSSGTLFMFQSNLLKS